MPSKEYRVYKPNKNNNGSALKIQYKMKPKQGKDYSEGMLFLEIAVQTGTDENGNASFDWAMAEGYKGKSVTMKLGLTDIGELLLVLNGKKEYAGPPAKPGQKSGMGLFHQNKNGNTVLKFGKIPNGYAAQLSTSKEHSFRISVSDGEAEILKVLLEQAILLIHRWNNK